MSWKKKEESVFHILEVLANRFTHAHLDGFEGGWAGFDHGDDQWARLRLGKFHLPIIKL